MFPVFKSIGEGAQTALGYVRAYPWHAAGLLGLYAASAALGGSGLIRLPLPIWLGGQISGWLIGALTMLLLAPVWVGVYRFAILKDTGRSWRQVDVRSRRVAGAMLLLAVVGLIGAVPFALALDVLPQIQAGKRLVLVAVAFAVVVKIAGWWLAARLAIAPAMAATGTKPQALDTSFTYTGGAVFRILTVKLLVQLPKLSVIGGLALLADLPGISEPPGSVLLVGIVTAVIGSCFYAATDLLDAAVMGRVALPLVNGYRARMAEKAKRARKAAEDDD